MTQHKKTRAKSGGTHQNIPSLPSTLRLRRPTKRPILVRAQGAAKRGRDTPLSHRLWALTSPLCLHTSSQPTSSALSQVPPPARDHPTKKENETSTHIINTRTNTAVITFPLVEVLLLRQRCRYPSNPHTVQLQRAPLVRPADAVAA